MLLVARMALSCFASGSAGEVSLLAMKQDLVLCDQRSGSTEAACFCVAELLLALPC